MWYGHMGNYWGNMGWFGFGLGWIFQLVFWGLIIWLIISLVRGHQGSWIGDGGRKEESALDILKKRYAKGEISKEEFERMKKDLE